MSTDDSSNILNEESIAKYSQEGYNCIKLGKYKEANEFFEKILQAAPNNHYAMVGMGDSLRRLNKAKEAIVYYQKCLDLFPDNNYALFGLAESYRFLRKYPEAIEAWEKYTKLDNQNITVMTRMADIYRKLKNLTRSREIYLEVLNIKADNVYAIIGLAHLSYEQHSYEESLQYWQRILQRKSARVDIRVLTSIGNCYRKLRNFYEALRYFEQAEDLEPNNFYVLYGLADSYRGLQNFEKSLEYWEKILAIGHRTPFVLTRIADTATSGKKLEMARNYYVESLNMDPNNLYAVLGLSHLETLDGNLSAAAKLLEDILEEHFRNPRLQTELAMLYCNMNETRKAYDNLDRYIQKGFGTEETMSLFLNLRDSIAANNE